MSLCCVSVQKKKFLHKSNDEKKNITISKNAAVKIMSDDEEDPSFFERMDMWYNFRDQSESVASAGEVPIVESATIPSVASLYERALKESPERATGIDILALGRLLEDGDPCEKRSVGKSHQDDPCRLSLHGRVWELALENIIYKDEADESGVMKKLLETYPSKLCDIDDVQVFFEDLVKLKPTSSQGVKKGETGAASGALNDVLVMHQHVSRPIRFIAYNNIHLRYFNFNKRKGLVKHLMTELPAEEVMKVFEFCRTPKTKLSPKMASEDLGKRACR